MRRIVIIEDDDGIAELARLELESCLGATHALEHHGRVRPARSSLLKRPADLLLLDLHLPDGDGRRFLAEVLSRTETRGMPVVMLTAEEPRRAMGECFAKGAVDYVSKPWPHGELGARVAHALARAGAGRLVWGPLALDVERHEASAAGTALTLTWHEFELLRLLMAGRGKAVSYGALLDAAWPETAALPVKTRLRTLQVHIGNLKKKLGGGARLLEAVPKVGYKLSFLSES